MQIQQEGTYNAVQCRYWQTLVLPVANSIGRAHTTRVPECSTSKSEDGVPFIPTKCPRLCSNSKNKRVVTIVRWNHHVFSAPRTFH
jgi:hypothetical protein